jgi:hypothetical protein
VVTLAAALLAACGGGGGDGGGGSGTPPPAPASLSISGTAARGAALAGATVAVKCASGTPSTVTATTAGSGAFSVTLDGATLPCVLRVTGTGGEVFHSVVAGTGSSGTFTANISPLTELMVAQIAGTAPGSFFDAFGSGSAVSAAALTQAVAYVKSAVAKVADLGSANPATDALVVGNALDQLIDQTVAGLSAAGVTLSAAVTAIAANPGAPTVLAAALAPAAADCAWLKSGTYRVIEPYESDPAKQARTAQIDVVALGGIGPDGDPFTMQSDGGCQFRINETDYITRLIVASSGLIVVQGESTVNSERNFDLVLPEQTLPLSEFAGTWNAASWEPVSSAPGAGRAAVMFEATFDAAGQVTALAECAGLAACVPETGPLSRLVVNPAGGFDEILPSGQTWSRVFLYKSLTGRRVAVWITPEQQFIVAVPKGPATLPVVGTASTYRDVQLAGNGAIAAPLTDTVTFTAVDAATKTVTRLRSSDNRVDTVRYDTPRDGLRHRAANACSVAGAGVACAEFLQLPTNLGITVTTSVGSTPAGAFFNFAVGKPGTATPSMLTPRAGHEATLLADGKVLITGGFSLAASGAPALNTAELFDPATNTFASLSNRMATTRTGHTATRLADGRVLLTGGQVDNNSGDGNNSAEIYDPATQTFAALTTTMSSPRGGHAAALLPNGKVLLAGGFFNSSVALNSAELFDPATNAFTPLTSTMVARRSEHAAEPLADGRVLIAGGGSADVPTATAEIFDPTSGTFSATAGSMSSVREGHSLTLLASGAVLVAGGGTLVSPPTSSTVLNSTERYDAGTQSFVANAATLALPRFFHAAVRLADGSVLISGGANVVAGSLVVYSAAERVVP